MNATLPSGLEISILLAAAMSAALAGTWLARKLSMALGAINPLPKRPDQLANSKARSPRSKANSHFGFLSQRGGVLAEQVASLQNWIAGLLTFAWGFAQATINGKQTAIRPGLAASQRRFKTTTATTVTADTPRITLDAQMERTARVVSDSVRSAKVMRSAHAVASEKLDAAHYAFEKLIGELDGIMAFTTASAEVTVFPYNRLSHGTGPFAETGRAAA